MADKNYGTPGLVVSQVVRSTTQPPGAPIINAWTPPELTTAPTNMTMPSTTADSSVPIRVNIDTDGFTTALTFAGNEYLVGGGRQGVEVWRATDGQQIASMEAENILCLATSKNAYWIAAGTNKGGALMWDGMTYKQFLKHDFPAIVTAVDFSPDSSRLIVASGGELVIWTTAILQIQRRFLHNDLTVLAAKYSPSGDRIAIATSISVRVWDHNLDDLLVDIPVHVTFSFNVCFLWSGTHIFVAASGSKIRQFESSTGSAVTEWPVPHNEKSYIALPQHGKFIAYSTKRTVMIWNTTTSQSLIHHSQKISSLAFSMDDQFLAVGGINGEIVIYLLKDILPSDFLVDAEASGTQTSISNSRQLITPAKRSLMRVLLKRSKAYVADGAWELALNDAHMVIELDPMSPWGYESKYTALHKAGDYENATQAFEVMLSIMSQSSDLEILELFRQYTYTRMVIRDAIQNIVRDLPHVLINTASGRLVDRSQHATAFQSSPAFNELIFSMKTNVDHTRIERDVAMYYRYAMLSHTWEDNEPLFDQVARVVVYDLEESRANDKLKKFCMIVRNAGLHWAWSDTCCINKSHHFVLQEALISMFRWYNGSSLTLVLLRGVYSPSRRGDLVKSVWNTRAWTFQEYHASRVLRFYNEDWTLYRNIDIPNHKDSLEILSEMEEVTGIAARDLMKFRPGAADIRKKLRLASTRQATFVEDTAYSLLGIFSLSLPVVYGEGDQALARLLAQLLTNSGNASILAWNGKSGTFNSTLPRNIHVFSQLHTSHVPPTIPDDEMESITSRLRKTSFQIALVTRFYDHLHDLPGPLFLEQRLRLPCILFGILSPPVPLDASKRVYHAQTSALGTVQIRTEEDLTQFNRLFLVHPWIDFLLDQHPVYETVLDDQSSMDELPSSPANIITAPSPGAISTRQPRMTRLISRFKSLFGGQTSTRPGHAAFSLSPASILSPEEKVTLALQALARLRQPFGALLFTLNTTRGVYAYTRVATESLITVQVREITQTMLDELINSVRVVDVL